MEIVSKRTNVAVLIVLVWFVVNDSIGSASEPEQEPKLLARFDESSSPLRSLFLYSDRELDAVYVWLSGKWTEATSKGSKRTGERPPHYVYRVATRFAPTDGGSLLVNSWSPTGENTYRHELQIAQAAADYRVSAQLVNSRSRDEYLATKRHRVLRPSSKPSIESRQEELSGGPYGFIPLLNQYRASRGLNPVVHDPALSQDAHMNNTINSPHGFMGRARVQN